MAQIRPFAALRPQPELVEQIAAPPYDVVDTEQARALAQGNPLSFLHISRSEIDFPVGADPYAAPVYQKAAENLRRLVREGALVREERPALYLYAQQLGEHRQQGIVACFAVDDYDSNLIRKHEHTRADKELDRTRHTDVTSVNSGPVFLTYRADPALDALVEQARQGAELLYDFVAPDGVGHTVHRIVDEALAARLQERFAAIAPLYVADGHHRSASAARVGRERRAREGNLPGTREHDWFMAVVFPHDQLRIMPYNRVVQDLDGRTPGELLARIGERFLVEQLTVRAYTPPARHTIGMYLAGRWYGLTPRQGTFPEGHPIEGLDVAILQKNLLAPLLGIQDPRTDRRISFVGGIHGPGKLEELVDGGKGAVAFSLFPVSLDELMAIADAGEVMPPKSTWFEPKLRSGLLVHELA